jgi:hypothetical protein
VQLEGDRVTDMLTHTTHSVIAFDFDFLKTPPYPQDPSINMKKIYILQLQISPSNQALKIKI